MALFYTGSVLVSPRLIAGKESFVAEEIPEKKSEMCRALARQLRDMSAHASLASRKEEILRQAEEWVRIAELAEEEEAAG
jgi:hypothetical protein